ncbi:MAG TPA: aldose 1-epimerase family protein [Solirubrobacteraceae bacterium]|jgi:aldose 1-epimerase|nr:aldose 1-epimerase family protein [Solirubrobacteraceae bacterium]
MDRVQEESPKAKSSMTSAPSGEQFEIALGEQRATIVEVGGGLREYTVAGEPVLHPYEVGEMCDGAHGAVLLPWPNRLADGRYEFDGERHQLALTEPAKRNAIHGLLRWCSWWAAEREPHRVVMATRLHPQTGYPFALDATVAYELGEDGLHVTIGAVNVGSRACPYGAGQHPYLSPGESTIDGCEFELPARTRLLVDERHQVPVDREPVEGTPFDFREPRQIGGLQIDSGFCDLIRDARGRATARLHRSDGSRVELWVDEQYEVLQVYTAHTLAPSRRRLGLAVEPMTCAANALQSGDGLARLEPGQAFSARWGVRLA